MNSVNKNHAYPSMLLQAVVENLRWSCEYIFKKKTIRLVSVSFLCFVFKWELYDKRHFLFVPPIKPNIWVWFLWASARIFCFMFIFGRYISKINKLRSERINENKSDCAALIVWKRCVLFRLSACSAYFWANVWRRCFI